MARFTTSIPQGVTIDHLT